MEKTISPAKSTLQYGALFGIIMILELVISFSFNISPENNKAYGICINIINFLVLPISLIVIGCNNYKNKLNQGFISFSEALKIGVTICVIAALIYSIFFVIFNMIFPEFMENILRQTRQALMKQSPDMPKEQFEMAMSMTKTMMQPAVIVPVTIIMYAFIGLIYSLIIGAIVKQERPTGY
ncbi:MAG: DUF4199 domain-containing protein [Flavobacterium sp.]